MGWLPKGYGPHTELYGILDDRLDKSPIVCVLDRAPDPDEKPRQYWCLRICNFDPYFCTAFLLLEKICPETYRFRRVGVAESFGESSGLKEVLCSGGWASLEII